LQVGHLIFLTGFTQTVQVSDLSAKEPEKKGQYHAEDQATDDGKVELEPAAIDKDVAWQKPASPSLCA
jgi:hypothetical protein